MHSFFLKYLVSLLVFVLFGSTALIASPQDSLSLPMAVPVPTAQAMDYYHSGNLLWGLDILLSIVILSVWLFTGASARLRAWADRRSGGRWYLSFLIYYAAFTVVMALVSLPFSYYTSYVRPHAYGLSDQLLTKWFSDTLLNLVISLILGAIVLWIPFRLVRRYPRRWWLLTTVGSFPVLLLLILITPVWIAPLFTKFGPMQDKVMEHRILALAGRAGIEGSRVFEEAKSVDTKTVNAYVNGLGSTKRIVIWDNTLKIMKPQETLFIVGHEAGHYVLGHVFISIAFFTLLVGVALFLAHVLGNYLLRRYDERFGFNSLGDVAAYPLILFLVSIIGLGITPLANAFSRYEEHEADRFALELTHTNKAGAEAFVKLQQKNLGNPRPSLLYKLWRADHPVLGDRIDFANTYKPWANGQPERYAHLFKTVTQDSTAATNK